MCTGTDEGDPHEWHETEPGPTTAVPPVVDRTAFETARDEQVAREKEVTRHDDLVQSVMFDPGWDEGCPSRTWAVDNLPVNMDRLSDEGIAFAMVSQAPTEKLEVWRAVRGWDHTWVSSFDTTYHRDWGWTQTDENGREVSSPATRPTCGTRAGPT